MVGLLNIGLAETLVALVVALLVFGDRLPEVAVKIARQVASLRRTLNDLRRESGIDRELYDIRRSLEETEREARVEVLPPEGPTAARSPREKPRRPSPPPADPPPRHEEPGE